MSVQSILQSAEDAIGGAISAAGDDLNAILGDITAAFQPAQNLISEALRYATDNDLFQALSKESQDLAKAVGTAYNDAIAAYANGGAAGVIGSVGHSIQSAINTVIADAAGITSSTSGGGTGTGGTSSDTGIVSTIESFISGIIHDIEDTFNSLVSDIETAIPKLEDIEAFFSTTIPAWGEGIYNYLDTNLFSRSITWFTGLKNSFVYYILGVGDVPPAGPWNIGRNSVPIFSTRDEADIFIESLNEDLTEPHGIFGVIKAVILRTALALTALGAALEPVIEEVRQEANRINPVDPLDVSSLIDAQYKGLIDAGAASLNAARRGVSPADYDILYRKASYDPAPSEAASWYLRGFIDLNGYNRLAANVHAQGTAGDVILKAAVQPVSATAALSAQGRLSAAGAGLLPGALNGAPPQAVTDLYKKAQLDEQQAAIDWRNHWSVPSPEWFSSAAFRGLLPAANVPLAAIANNYPPELAGVFLELARPIVPVRVTTSLLSKGVITEDQARHNYARLGYAPADIDTLVAYAGTMVKKEKGEGAAALSRLAIGSAVALYMDGVFTADQLKQVYAQHGYSDEAATLEVEHILLKEAAAERKAVALDIIDSVAEGVYDQAQGVSNLHSLGYTNREVLRYTKLMAKARSAKIRAPSDAQVKAMFKAGFVDEQGVIDYLTAQGYADKWIAPLAALIIKPDLTTGGTTP